MPVASMPTFVDRPMSDEWKVKAKRMKATGSKRLHLFSYQSKTKPYGVVHWGGEDYEIVSAEPALKD